MSRRVRRRARWHHRADRSGRTPVLASLRLRCATAAMGPSSAMRTSRCAGWTRYLRRGLLTAREHIDQRREAREARENLFFADFRVFSVDALCRKGAGGSGLLLPHCFPKIGISEMKLDNRTIGKLTRPPGKADHIEWDDDL